MSSTQKVVRIGGASGFWGDSALAAPQLVEVPELNYLTFDYLAELTMSILAKARDRNPEQGYATDFVDVAMRSVIHQIAARGIKVLANAGGVNPQACARALHSLAEQEGVQLKITVVEGDDVRHLSEAFRDAGVRDLHTGAVLPDKLMSANAYLGARPIVAALDAGAQVVITGRCVDSALPLAALVHEFGWRFDEYDKLAAGSLAGHLIECGPQGCGGLFTDWEEVPDWDSIGYPVLECHADGTFVLTKPEGTGGLVTPATVAEQMLYEVGDPAHYLLPDVCCDFTAVNITTDGPQRVRVERARGGSPTDTYKVCTTYADGWRCVANLTLIGGRAERKAERTVAALLARVRPMLKARGWTDFRRVYHEVLGTEASFGAHSRVPINREVVLRIVVEHDERAPLKLFASEIAPAAVSWAPGLTSIGGGRPSPGPIVRQFSFLWPKAKLQPVLVTEGNVTPLAPDADDADTVTIKPSCYPDSVKPPEDDTTEVPLLRIAHGRSGDKGNSVNIGVIARHPKWLPVLQETLTAERVADYFAHLVQGPVERFDVPGVGGFNFLLDNALDGGGMASPRSDPLGKAFAQMLLDMPISVPTAWLTDSTNS